MGRNDKKINKEDEYMVRWLFESLGFQEHKPMGMLNISKHLKISRDDVIESLNDSYDEILTGLSCIGLTRDLLWELIESDRNRVFKKSYSILPPENLGEQTTRYKCELANSKGDEENKRDI